MSGRKRHAAAKRDSRPRKAQRAAPAAETSTARPPGRAARPAGTPAAAPTAPEHVLPRTDRPAAPEATVGAAIAATTATTAIAAPTVPVSPDAPAAPHPAGAPEAPEAAEAPAAPAPPRWTAEDAFDALYVRTAAALLRQTTVLTGDPAAAHRAVAHAFDLAWQQWPDVARDTDPAGWVRAAAYEYALAPWQRWLPHRGPGSRQEPAAPERSDEAPAAAEQVAAEQVGAELSGKVLTALAAALRGLEPARRRAVLLVDGVGLDLAAAAVESEASTGAMAGRIVRGREELAAAVPGLPGVAVALGALLDAGGEEAAGLPEQPKRVRDASERGVRRRTVGAYALTGLIAVLTLVVVLVGPGTGAHASGPGAGPDAGPGAGPGTRSGGTAGDAAGRPPFGEPARDLLP